MISFEEWLDSYQQTDSYAVGDVEDDIKAAWNAAKEPYKPKWISVEDRLPDKEGDYVLKVEGWETKFIRYFENGDFKNRSRLEITHWMEIPE